MGVTLVYLSARFRLGWIWSWATDRPHSGTIVECRGRPGCWTRQEALHIVDVGIVHLAVENLAALRAPRTVGRECHRNGANKDQIGRRPRGQHQVFGWSNHTRLRACSAA